MTELFNFIRAMINQGLIKADWTGQIIINLQQGKNPKVQKKESVRIK